MFGVGNLASTCLEDNIYEVESIGNLGNTDHAIVSLIFDFNIPTSSK